MIILHSTAAGPTGLGYTLQGLLKGLNDLEIPATHWQADPAVQIRQMDPTWSIAGYHVVIDQPMQVETMAPWFAFMPFFELPPREDERPKLKVWGKKRILCANPQIHEWAFELNRGAHADQFPLVTLGADPIDFDVERVPYSVVTVGKAEPRKGTRILLRALQRLGAEAYLAITSPLHTQVEVERLQDYADAGGHTLIPFSPVHEDVLSLLQSCHVAVFPSCAEGWNLGLTEALAQGCVVVASDIPAHRWQHQILTEELGAAEVARRWVWARTTEVPMTHHQRWYPSHIYHNVLWSECSVEDLAAAIQEAQALPIPRPWGSFEFPLTWRKAAERLCSAISYLPTNTTDSNIT